MKGVLDIRLRIQCEAKVDHAKILPMRNFFRTPEEVASWQPIDNADAEIRLKTYFANRLGEILCGKSGMYIYKPGDGSPIGRCALCGAGLSFTIEELGTEA